MSSRSERLSPVQIAALVAIGAALWLAGVLILRTVGPMGAYEGIWRFILYAGIFVGTAPFVPLSARLVRLAPHQILSGTALATMAALFIDGGVFAWFPWIYGATPEMHIGAAAAVLWGAASAIALGFLFNKARDA